MPTTPITPKPKSPFDSLAAAAAAVEAAASNHRFNMLLEAQQRTHGANALLEAAAVLQPSSPRNTKQTVHAIVECDTGTQLTAATRLVDQVAPVI